MSVRKKCLLLIVCIMLPQAVFAQEEYNFMSDCLTAFSTLHKMTIEYESDLKNPPNIKKAEEAITKFNNEILIPLNLFVKGTKADNSQIKDVSKDLKDLLSDILTNNYDMLLVLKNENLDEKGLKEKCTALIQKNNFASHFFGNISMGVCMAVGGKIENEGTDKQKQYINLTIEERETLNKFLLDDYGDSIKKGLEVESETSYEQASRVIYEFLNLPWVFLKPKQ